MGEETIAFKSGVLSTAGPPFELIPLPAAVALALRFGRGVRIKGKDGAWNALSNQEALKDKDFIVNRLGHAIAHSLSAIECLAQGKPLPELEDGGDAGAIMFAGALLACFVASIKEPSNQLRPEQIIRDKREKRCQCGHDYTDHDMSTLSALCLYYGDCRCTGFRPIDEVCAKCGHAWYDHGHDDTYGIHCSINVEVYDATNTRIEPCPCTGFRRIITPAKLDIDELVTTIRQLLEPATKLMEAENTRLSLGQSKNKEQWTRIVDQADRALIKIKELLGDDNSIPNTL